MQALCLCARRNKRRNNARMRQGSRRKKGIFAHRPSILAREASTSRILRKEHNLKNKILTALATFILPIALFIISPYWSAHFSDKKELSYEILSTRELTNLDSLDQTWPDIKISYNGVDVSTGSFLTLAITNTGKLPIKREDFDSQIFIDIPDSAAIVSFKATYSSPGNLDIKLGRFEKGITVDKLLLNPGDRFFIEIFSKNPIVVTDVNSRIVGLPAIIKAQTEPRAGFYVGITPTNSATKALSPPIAHIPYWSASVITYILFTSIFLLTWAALRNTDIIAKITIFFFAGVIYILALAGLNLSTSYFLDILQVSKWSGIAIQIFFTLISVCIAEFLRRRNFLGSMTRR